MEDPLNTIITRIVGEIGVDNESVVITDPCYLLHNSSDGNSTINRINGKSCSDPWMMCNCGRELQIFGVERFVTASTLYGDWSCTVCDPNEVDYLLQRKIRDVNTIYGEFCADSGLVTIIPLEEVNKFNPDWIKWHENHDLCSTIIPRFTGLVRIVEGYRGLSDSEESLSNLECWVEGHGNIEFVSCQTGL